MILKRDKIQNRFIGLGWLFIAGFIFWVNAFSIFSNHRENKARHPSGIDYVTEIPARTSFGDDLITEEEFHDPLYPHRRIPIIGRGIFASPENDGQVDEDNITSPRARLEKDFLNQGFEEDLSMLAGEAHFGNCLNGIFTMNYDGFNCCCAYATESCQGLARISFGFPALPIDENGQRGKLPGYVRAVIDARWFRTTYPNTQNKNRSLNKSVDFNSGPFQSGIKFLPNYLQWRYIINKDFDPDSEQPEGLKNLISYCKGNVAFDPSVGGGEDNIRKSLIPNPSDPLSKDFRAFLPKDTPNGRPDWTPNPRTPYDTCVRPYDTKDVAGRRVYSSDLHVAYEMAEDYCYNKIPPVPHMSSNGLFKDKLGRHARWNNWADRYETHGVDSKTNEAFDHRFKIKHSNTFFHYRASLPYANRYGYEFNCVLEVARPFELEVRHVDPCPPMVKYSDLGKGYDPKNCVQSEGYEYQDTHSAFGPVYIVNDAKAPNSLRLATNSEYPPGKHPSFFGEKGMPNMNCVDAKRKCLRHDRWTKKCNDDGTPSGDSSVIFPPEHEAKANAWENHNIPAHDHGKCKPLEWDFFAKQYIR
ncbi:MAG TPA: hypothetical protein PK079_12355 [Leptospiraceae bacterium]|nr:hypothetical protein [Leptospiraceae bacterium]HMW05866.1 hypothetical protein [Leptospiraceae bacterium]HMX33204.1 hypothetical protein [Leptospiraceae bacterium]HMY33652.1 hypothetical protein [Leptospiraceae bacterium]HMZ64098.1 hypothetical protein [Leptospiraceae bacterium]